MNRPVEQVSVVTLDQGDVGADLIQRLLDSIEFRIVLRGVVRIVRVPSRVIGQVVLAVVCGRLCDLGTRLVSTRY